MNPNLRHTPEGWLETPFRCQVRDLLDLDMFARDEQIFEKLRRWKRLMSRTNTIEDIRAILLEEREKRV